MARTQREKMKRDSSLRFAAFGITAEEKREREKRKEKREKRKEPT
jgi:hypothetical protein